MIHIGTPFISMKQYPKKLHLLLVACKGFNNCNTKLVIDSVINRT